MTDAITEEAVDAISEDSTEDIEAKEQVQSGVLILVYALTSSNDLQSTSGRSYR